jgi:hypothetical protein
MRQVGVAVLFASVLLAGGSTGAAGEAPARRIRVRAVAIETSRLPPASFELMVRELDALLSGAGVEIAWRRAPASGETAPGELRAVFLGSPARGAYADRPILAASGPAQVSPTIWVFLPTVRQALGRRAGRAPEAIEDERELGLALGRVLAHELVHVLAPAVAHGEGLMASSFRLVALEEQPSGLEPPEREALSAAARAWLGGARGR